MLNDFDKWNELKKNIDIQPDNKRLFPNTGEVWMCSLGKNIGFEQNGGGNNFSRPVLVVKKFNNQMFWVIPLSTKQKKLDFYFNFTDVSGQKVSGILAQLRLLSTKRFNRKMYNLSAEDLKHIGKKLKNFLP